VSTARRLKLWLAAILALLAFATHAQQQQVLEVLTLGYRQADEVIPLLRPLLAPGGTLTGTSNRLIVRTTPANLAELKQVLAVMDSRPRQLVISVRQGAAVDVARDRASVSGSAGGGDAQVTVTPPPGTREDPSVTVQTERSRIEGRGIGSGSTQDSSVMQSVRVLEGNSAFIRAGQSVPVTSSRIVQGSDGQQVTRTTGFANADTGFYVTPRLNGDRVTLEVSTDRDRVQNPNTGRVHVQRLSTVVSGRLGEWIAVGGSSESAERARDDPLSQRRSSTRDDRRIMLKVDEVR